MSSKNYLQTVKSCWFMTATDLRHWNELVWTITNEILNGSLLEARIIKLDWTMGEALLCKHSWAQEVPIRI